MVTRVVRRRRLASRRSSGRVWASGALSRMVWMSSMPAQGLQSQFLEGWELPGASVGVGEEVLFGLTTQGGQGQVDHHSLLLHRFTAAEAGALVDVVGKAGGGHARAP